MGRPAKYPTEFRREAIELVRSSGRPIAEVARSLDIAEGTLRICRPSCRPSLSPNRCRCRSRRSTKVCNVNGLGLIGSRLRT